jgi:hypothetical protein
MNTKKATQKRGKMRNRLAIICVFMILAMLANSCSAIKRTELKNSQEFLTYLRLQESIVDNEEYQRNALKEEDTIKLVLLDKEKQLESLTKQIEEKNQKKNYLQETPKTYYKELPNPRDRIREDQLKIDSEEVTLKVNNVYWGYMLDSNSMDPLLDQGTTILTIKPSSEKEISIGDIIVFTSNLTTYNIVHRVDNISEDDIGLYYVTKGDNNPEVDPIRVRYKEIIAIVVGILY